MCMQVAFATVPVAPVCVDALLLCAMVIVFGVHVGLAAVFPWNPGLHVVVYWHAGHAVPVCDTGEFAVATLSQFASPKS